MSGAMGGGSGRSGFLGAGVGGMVNDRGTVDHGFEPPSACAFHASPACAGEGLSCRSITIDGAVRACLGYYSAPASCDPGRPEDECCSNDDCIEGPCLWSVPYPRTTTCGEPDSFPAYNRCYEGCYSDDDCPASNVCTSADPFGVRQCLPAACKSDADCAERPFGVCRLFTGGCCLLGEPGSGGCDVCQATLPGPFRAYALACTYPEDGCRYDDDCPAGSQCTVVGGVAACRVECTENTFAPSGGK